MLNVERRNRNITEELDAIRVELNAYKWTFPLSNSMQFCRTL